MAVIVHTHQSLASTLWHPLVTHTNHPCRSKLAASVLAGVDNIHIKPGAKVLYLGAASGTSVSHVSDIVGKDGAVYAVEFSHRSGERAARAAFSLGNCCASTEVSQTSLAGAAWLDVWQCALPTVKPLQG